MSEHTEGLREQPPGAGALWELQASMIEANLIAVREAGGRRASLRWLRSVEESLCGVGAPAVIVINGADVTPPAVRDRRDARDWFHGQMPRWLRAMDRR